MTEQQQLLLSTRLFSLLRTMQMAIIVMSLFYVFLAELLRRNGLQDVSNMLPIVAALALVESAVVVYLKQVKIPLTEEILRVDSEDTAGLAAARKWYVVALACCAGVSLYGFALRIMGSTFWLAAIFYASGMALALYCTPRKPE
jgi:hypothetical protein